MKKLTKIISMILLSATVLTGCGNAATLSINEAAVMTPVDSFYTDEVREYTDEGTIEEPEMIISSDDGLCVIRKMPSYFDITLDYEKGDRASVGRAYGTLIREKLPDFVPMFEPYIYENIKVAYDGEYSVDALENRLQILFSSLRPEYQEEITAFAEGLSNGVRGFAEDGVLSYEEVCIMQMIPDALRPTCCSALSLWGSKTETGDRLTLRNLEWNLGSDNQMGKVQAVTRMKNGYRSITAFSVLGLLDIISGINDDGVFAAILDVGSVQEEPFIFEGKKCYTMELRYALEEYSTARELGEFMVGESGDFTWCHNLIISDESDSFCAEDCVSQVVEKGMGKSILRDCDTPILKGLSWDSSDSLCVVNSFAAEGNQDGFTGSGSNTIRFAKYNEWVKAKDKFSAKDLKDMITQEKVDQYTVQNVHGKGSAQLIIVDYHAGTVQIAFSGPDGVTDKPDFIEVDRFGT
ncbi:MAG: hypothetical protein J6U54_20985 [Clostridiales bacterium]|nr:hypothetical protein [Clostridiales bacterium]